MQKIFYGLFEGKEARSDFVYDTIREAERQKAIYEKHGHGPFSIRETSASGRAIVKSVREAYRVTEDERTFEQVYGKSGVGDTSKLVPEYVRGLRFRESSRIREDTEMKYPEEELEEAIRIVKKAGFAIQEALSREERWRREEERDAKWNELLKSRKRIWVEKILEKDDEFVTVEMKGGNIRRIPVEYAEGVRERIPVDPDSKVVRVGRSDTSYSGAFHVPNFSYTDYEGTISDLCKYFGLKKDDITTVAKLCKEYNKAHPEKDKSDYRFDWGTDTRLSPWTKNFGNGRKTQGTSEKDGVTITHYEYKSTF